MTPQKITDAPLPYLLYTPDAPENVPLVLFLHGSGERGSDLEHVATVGLPHLLGYLPEPTFVVAPQCPEDMRWTDHLEALEAILDDLIRRFPVDPSRVYLTGLSMGGQGAWVLAAHTPQRFAAAVPICGRSNPDAAERLKRLPIKVFHGAEDTVVPLGESQKMVDALRAVGGQAELTVYPGVGHDSWTPAYSDPELYRWLFQQRLPG